MESADAKPPDSEEVASRALVLRTVVVHALATPPPQVRGSMMNSWTWLDRLSFRWEATRLARQHWKPLRQAGLWSRLSPWELSFARMTATTMKPRHQIHASWRIEALVVLLWALRCVDEFPPFDAQTDHQILKGFPQTSPPDFIASARLRPLEELEKRRSEAELWHWRSRTRELHDRGSTAAFTPDLQAQGISSFDDIVRTTARSVVESGDGPEIVEEDFAVSGMAYRDLSPEAWATVRSISVERHYALNWLTGHAPGNAWDETPTDT